MMKLFAMFCLTSLTAYSYPRILDWKNSPLVVFENNSNAVIKKNQELKAPFFALTSRLDELRLELNSGNELSIFKNSKVQVYEVFEDVHQEHILFLIDGELRYKNSHLGDKVQNSNRLRTPFFDLMLPVDAEVIIHLDMKEPSIEIMQVKGNWDVEFFAYEKKAHLNAGQRVKFKGELAEERDQIKYDFLLQDKKIPKGSLQKIEKFDLKSFETQKQKSDRELLKKEKAEKRQVVEKVKKKNQFEKSFLCRSPFANLNQCFWTIENDICYRSRCNVSGKWGDRTERPFGSACTSVALVGTCDY